MHRMVGFHRLPRPRLKCSTRGYVSSSPPGRDARVVGKPPMAGVGLPKLRLPTGDASCEASLPFPASDGAALWIQRLSVPPSPPFALSERGWVPPGLSPGTMRVVVHFPDYTLILPRVGYMNGHINRRVTIFIKNLHRRSSDSRRGRQTGGIRTNGGDGAAPPRAVLS